MVGQWECMDSMYLLNLLCLLYCSIHCYIYLYINKINVKRKKNNARDNDIRKDKSKYCKDIQLQH